MHKTKIPWADYTWNPVTGCTPVSEGCKNCYARRIDKRFNDGDFKVTVHPDRLGEKTPQSMKCTKCKGFGVLSEIQTCYRCGGKGSVESQIIFVCSVSDLFHEDVPDEFILNIWQVFSDNPQCTFLVLTKHPERMAKFVERLSREDGLVFLDYPLGHTMPFFNVWLGVTAENQRAADERIPILLRTPAAKRFLSCEPLLENIKLVLSGTDKRFWDLGWMYLSSKIDWVIAGGESGPGARECREEWVSDLYEQCQSAGVPFFFKQYGRKWIPDPYCPMGAYDWEKIREMPS